MSINEWAAIATVAAGFAAVCYPILRATIFNRITDHEERLDALEKGKRGSGMSKCSARPPRS